MSPRSGRRLSPRKGTLKKRGQAPDQCPGPARTLDSRLHPPGACCVRSPRGGLGGNAPPCLASGGRRLLCRIRSALCLWGGVVRWEFPDPSRAPAPGPKDQRSAQGHQRSRCRKHKAASGEGRDGGLDPPLIRFFPCLSLSCAFRSVSPAF